MAENSFLQRINVALKESVGGVAAERFGSAGRYINSRLNDEKPESFRKILKRDFKAGATKNMGAIGRAIANKDGDKNSDRNTSNTIRNSSNRTSSEIGEIKQQNSNINQTVESVNYRLKRVDAKLEDMLLSQERIEIIINRLLYKKEPPPVVEQTVNNVTNNITNNNTNNTNNANPRNNLRRNRGAAAGAGAGAAGAGATLGGATPRALSTGAALGLGAAGGAAVGIAGAAAVGAAGGGSAGASPTGSTTGSTGLTQGSGINQTSALTPSARNTSGDARPAGGNAATQEAMQFFQSKGWTKEQAAGIVGNLQTESGNFAPDVIAGRRKGDGGKAVGIAQWHPPRQADFQREMGEPVEGASLKKQLEFVNWELNNSYKKAGNILRTITDAAQAAVAVDEHYEKSKGIHRNQRIANARALAGGQTTAQSPSSGISPSAAPTGSAASPNSPSAAPTGSAASPSSPSAPSVEPDASPSSPSAPSTSVVPTQTMSGVLPEYPSRTRGGGSDTQAMYPQDRSGGPAPWQGRPDRQQGGQEQGGMTTLKTASGKSFTVAAQYADKFKGFVDALEGSGYKINSIGGFANRSTASGGFSWHSKGMAIDINPSENPHTFPGSQNYGKTDMPSNIRELAARFGLGWGGDWKSSKDTMHFSAGGNEGGSGTKARGGTMASTGENESKSRPGSGGASSSPMSGGKVAGAGSALGNYGPMQGGMSGAGMMGGGLGGIGGMIGGMMGGRGMGQIGMGGGLGGIGGMIGGMLGGKSGPAGGMIGSILGNAIGNMTGRAMMPTPVQQPINTGADLGNRSSERSESRERYNRPRSNGPQNTPSHTTPSSKRFGVDEMPTVTPTGGFAEVLGGGVAGALVESLGSNSISVNRRQSVGSLIS